MSMWPVIERSVDKADCRRCSEMAAKKIKLQEETIGEILVANTDSESGTEASDFEEEEQQQQQQQASAEVGGKAAASGGLPTGGPPQGRKTNIHPFVDPAKGVKKKVRLQTSTKTAHHCLCCCCFLQKFFISFW